MPPSIWGAPGYSLMNGNRLDQPVCWSDADDGSMQIQNNDNPSGPLYSAGMPRKNSLCFSVPHNNIWRGVMVTSRKFLWNSKSLPYDSSIENSGPCRITTLKPVTQRRSKNGRCRKPSNFMINQSAAQIRLLIIMALASCELISITSLGSWFLVRPLFHDSVPPPMIYTPPGAMS